MPFYQYSVSNKQGQLLEGTLQAANHDAARLALSNAGYSIYEIRERLMAPQTAQTPAPPRTVPPPKPAPPSARVTPPPPRPKPVELASSPKINAVTGGKTAPARVKTKPGRDKDLFFLFTQMGSYFRSGINPAQALVDLTARTRPLYHDSLRYAAQVVSEGGRLSDALEHYPYLYPPDVIGVLRAGEASGFLPDATDEIARKMESSNHIKRRLFYFQWLFATTVLVTPVILAVIQGSLYSIQKQDVAGGTLNTGKVLGTGFLLSFLRDLPISLAVFGVIWAFHAWFNSMKMRDFRHKLVLRTPVIGPRARIEALSRFTWALGLISRGGLSPQSTYLLALQSVPNMALRRQLEAQGHQMTESDRLSSALRKTNLVPFEYGAIVETGEVTGDVPRALDSVYRASENEFQAQNATAVTRSSLFLYLVLGLVITVIAGWLLVKWYGGLFTTILGD